MDVGDGLPEASSCENGRSVPQAPALGRQKGRPRCAPLQSQKWDDMGPYPQNRVRLKLSPTHAHWEPTRGTQVREPCPHTELSMFLELGSSCSLTHPEFARSTLRQTWTVEFTPCSFGLPFHASPIPSTGLACDSIPPETPRRSLSFLSFSPLEGGPSSVQSATPRSPSVAPRGRREGQLLRAGRQANSARTSITSVTSPQTLTKSPAFWTWCKSTWRRPGRISAAT